MCQNQARVDGDGGSQLQPEVAVSILYLAGGMVAKLLPNLYVQQAQKKHLAPICNLFPRK
jgi:hypothetical protein